MNTKSNLLKSIFISLILLVGATNAWGATQTYVAGEYIYIKNFVPSGWGTTTWILSNSYAWAHMWGGTAGTQDYLFELYSGTAGSSGAIYRAKVTTDGTYTNVIFTRNSSNKGPWKDKWNQTGDIVLDGSSNCFTAFTADKTSKTCSKYAATPTAATLILDGAISGDGSQANPYNVNEGVNYTLTASGTFPDPGNTPEYAFNNETYSNTNTKTVSFTSGTTSYYANVRAAEGSEYSTAKKVTIYLNVIQPTYSYTVTAGQGGKVSPASGTVVQGSGVTITATPDDGYEFNNWTATNGTLANANSASTTFTPSANNANAVASFKVAGCTQTPTTPTSLTAKVDGNALAGEVCSGTSVTLTAGGSISVGSLQWGTGTVGKNIIAEGNGRSSITVSPAATTTYWVRSIITEAGVCEGVTSDAKTLQVSITPALVQPVLSKSTLTLEEGGSTGSITVTSGTTGGTWTSSDQNVATVDNGTVTSVGPGTATITYTASNGCEEDKTATCDVTVTAKPYYIAGRLQQNWNTSSTTQQFTYVSNGQYKYETGKTVAELSVQWQDNSYTADQSFFIHAGEGKAGTSTYPFWTTKKEDGSGHNFEAHIGESNAIELGRQETNWDEIVENRLMKFTDVTNNSSDVVIWWEPLTNKLWYTATANLNTNYYLLGFGNSNWDIKDARRFVKDENDPTKAKVTITLAQGEYKYNTNDGFKINDNFTGKWYGNNSTMTRKSCTGWSFEEGKNNAGLTADIAGDYVFTLDLTTMKLSVTYPTLTQYTITYNTNGGDEISQEEYNETQAVTLPKPTRTGYTFAGWYDNEGCTGEPITTIPQGSTGNKTFHAKWTADQYTITYNDLYGVTHANPTTYTIESETITFTNPTSERTGYTFKGWNPTEITKGSTGNKTVTAQWNEILSTITITTNPAEGGRIEVDEQPFTPGNTVQVGVATTKKVTAVPNEGYGVAAWGVSNREIVNASGGATVTLKSDGSGSTGTLTANFIGLEYTITFDKQKGTEGTDNVIVRYKNNNYSVSPVVAPTRTGFTFGGYYSKEKGAGEQVVSAEGAWLSNANGYTDADGNWLVKENTTLYAHWIGAEYTVELNQEGAAKEGSTTSVVANFEGNMPEITGDGALPTPQNGYAFMGYFDQKDGKGTQYYNADGTSAHTWDKTDNTTLYAYFKAAEITTINLDKTTFEPVEAGSTGFVTATPIIEPEPTGTTTICWRLLYSNGTPVEGHNASTEGCEQKNQVKFSIAGLASGNYKIEAVLRTGDNCESGTELSTKTVNFTIASTYTITVKYTCDGKEIMAPTKKPAHVTEETEITAPDITGYTFSSWEAGDGVTIKSTNDNSVKITAFYDGYLTAKYTARPMVYFKNTLGWEKVYVYTFSDNAWWNDNGQGVHPGTNKREQGEMTLVEGTTDIYYFELSDPDSDYTQENNATPNYIAFSNVDYRNDNGAFRSGKAIYRGDHKAELTLFIPQADQTPSTTNQTKYYNKGIWMKYNSTESGYQMPTNNSVNDNPPGLGTDDGQGWSTYGNKFTAQTPGGYKFSITKHLEANKTYEFKIKNYVYVKDWQDQDKNEWYGYNENSNTITDSKCTELHFHEESDKKHDCGNAKIKTTAEGEYIFTIDLSKGKVLLSVEYPVAVGDYRVIYTDTATWSQGTAHGANWYHPSRIIKKNKANEPTKDIISFFISFGKNTMMRFQKVQSITNGNVTWEDAGEARIPDNIKEAGVYNFIVTQTANGESISMEDNAEPYTGNYYIRCDAVGGKWDNYKTHSENRMTYSAFSESKANSFGEKFSHYATKYCTNGTKIEFTIANDYSPCISDTLAQDITNPLDNLDSEGRLLNNDIYSANVRFMWNHKTNKISRAYVGPAADKQSQFLMLRTKDEIQGAAGELDPDEGDILDEENNIYAARFADTQNWMYERTIRVKPGTRVKLYASYPKIYHIYIDNQTGWNDIALYAWKDGGGEPLGTWPGIQPSGTVVIEGKTYHDFQVNEWVFNGKLKLNNNNNGKETNEYAIGSAGNYYLTAKNNQLSLKENGYKANVIEATAQYFRGAYDNNNETWDDNNSIVILGGSGTDWNTIRVIYDFKTNRLMAALVPDQEVSEEKIIAADVMIIRKHQENATCITLTNDNSKLTEVKTVYGSLQFNRWVLNNRDSEKSGIEYCTKKIDNQDTYDEEVTNNHHPILGTQDQKTIYERALYFISFPFDVHLSDVFGFGTYGTHWVISTYNGQRRAQNGYFVDNCMNEDCTNWDYIWDPSDFTMKANQGYLLSLDLDLMKYNNTDFWLHNIDQVELFFPSTANIDTIERTNYTMPSLRKEDYECTINFNKVGPEDPTYNPVNDHRVRDSYWRCIGVPSFANYDGSLYKTEQDAENEENAINWKDSYTWQADNAAFPFLYEWQVTDNSLQVQNTRNFNFKATFAYLVQNGDSIYWSAVNAKPSNIVARKQEAKRNYDWKITIARNGEVEDQTFVRLSDNEQVTTEFDFNQDLSKEFNYGRSDIYTLIGYEKAAANSLPLSEQTTLIPLGLSIEYNGDYTIAMPDGTANIGVTLIDTESNTRTNLSAGMEYTLTLKKGDYNNRFFIEISPIQQTPTDIEYVENSHDDQARKVLIDNILYIVRDGQIFDARGARVQ